MGRVVFVFGLEVNSGIKRGRILRRREQIHETGNDQSKEHID